MVSRLFAIASQNQGLRPPDAGSIRRTQLVSSRGACVVQLGAHAPAHLLQESLLEELSSQERRRAGLPHCLPATDGTPGKKARTRPPQGRCGN